MNIPRLMLVTPGNLIENPQGLHRIKNACGTGIQGLQLREKQLEGRNLWKLACHLRDMTAEHGIFFTVNERADVAVSVGADGVHLTEAGLQPYIIKDLYPWLTIGVSTHSYESAMRAQQEGADYILFGPIFSTPSKLSYGPPLGINHLKFITQRLTIPVIAIGGIIPSNTKACIQAGAYGVSAIGAFFCEDNSYENELKIQEFLKELI